MEIYIMLQYQSQIKRSLSTAQLALSRPGEEVTTSLPFLAILARKTERPPRVIGNATLLAVLSILIFNPNGVAPILSDLLIFFPIFTKSLNFLLISGSTQSTIPRGGQWQGLVEFWVVFSGITFLESVASRESLSQTIPLYWALKVVFFGWIWLSAQKPLPRARPNPLHLAVSNISVTKPSLPSVKEINKPRMKQSDPTETPLSTAEPPTLSDESIISDVSPSSPFSGTSKPTRAPAKASKYPTSESEEPSYDDSDDSASSEEQSDLDSPEAKPAPVATPPKGTVAEAESVPNFASPKGSTASGSPLSSSVELRPRSPNDGADGLSPVSDGEGAFDLDDIPILADNLSPRTSPIDINGGKHKEEGSVYLQSMTLDELLLLEGQEDDEVGIELSRRSTQGYPLSLAANV